MRTPIALIMLLIATGPAAARLGVLDLPQPEAFLHSEDRQRVRLYRAPCSASDAGRGCYTYKGELVRKYPCATYDDKNTVTSLPTDRCYRMTESRRYRGVWINAFEGQLFIPEEPVPVAYPKRTDRASDQRIWLNTEKLGLRRRAGSADRLSIEFIGRRTRYAGHFGHLGASDHEIIVDQLISMRPIDGMPPVVNPRLGIPLPLR